MTIALVIHGGADPRRPEAYSEASRLAQRTALLTALRAGHGVLRAGGAALDAVEAAVMSLEDSGQFDAGRGAYRSVDGGFDLDASIMDGRTGAAGAAAHLHHVRNPIRLARRVMERTSPCACWSPGGRNDSRATRAWISWTTITSRRQCQPRRKYTSHRGRLEPWARWRWTPEATWRRALPPAGFTSGARAAWADTPIIGAGTYADNRVGAVSGTGQGEYFLRAVLAHDIAARVEHGGRTLAEAAEAAMREKLTERGGSGGIIALDPAGHPVMVFNTPTMARGVVIGMDGAPKVALFDEELE